MEEIIRWQRDLTDKEAEEAEATRQKKSLPRKKLYAGALLHRGAAADRFSKEAPNCDLPPPLPKEATAHSASSIYSESTAASPRSTRVEVDFEKAAGTLPGTPPPLARPQSVKEYLAVSDDSGEESPPPSTFFKKRPKPQPVLGKELKVDPTINFTQRPTMLKSRNAADAEAKAEVEVLQGQVAQSKDLAKRLKASLARLQSGGENIKQVSGPVFSQTQIYQTIAENADNLYNVIERRLAPSEDKNREESIIRGGPGQVGLTEYLASLRRLERSLSQMTSANFRANQQTIGDFNELISEGNKQLQDLFRSKLADTVRPVEPLHFITKQLMFPTIPQERISELKAIDAFISSPTARDASYNQRESPSVRIYSECRGPYLSNSLQNLSTASIITSKKKIADEIYRRGTSGIGTYASGIEGMFLAEFQNISTIFPRGDWGAAFETTCRKALAEFAKTLRELNMHIKSNLATDCFLAYEIVEIVTNLSFRLDTKTGELKLPFADALKPVRETAKSSLSELLDDIRRRVQSMIAFPMDGASIPFTTDIMTRLQFMTLYPQSLGSIMTSLGDGNWVSGTSTKTSSSASLDVGADGGQLLAHYILDTLDILLTSYEAKARQLLKGKSLFGVFMANNIAVIERMIRSSDLAPVLSSSTATAKIDAWRRKGTSAYLDSWREPCSALMDVQYTNRPGARPPSGNNGVIDSTAVVKALGSKDKDAIKEKFKTFNSSFDELSNRHKTLAMEREVRSLLAREVQAMIEPLYARFWDRYHEIDKGKGKYVKYDKGSLSAQLANLG